MGIAELLSMCDFSISLMQHFERSSATSAEFCTALSEYKTQGLRPQTLISAKTTKNFFMTL